MSVPFLFMRKIHLPFDLQLADALAVLESEKNVTLVNPGNPPAKAFLIESFLESTPFRNIFWASTDEQVDVLAASAGVFFPGIIHVIPQKLKAKDVYTIQRCLEHKDPFLFLFEDLAQTLEQKFPNKKQLEGECKTLRKGHKIEIFQFFQTLGKMGYKTSLDKILLPGEFVRRGDTLFLFSPHMTDCMRISLFGDEIEAIEVFDQETQKIREKKDECMVYPAVLWEGETSFLDFIGQHNTAQTLLVSDDLDIDICPVVEFSKIRFTSFPRETENFFHLNFFSVLPFYTTGDFVMEIKERLRRQVEVVVVTKRAKEIEKIFVESHIMWTEKMEDKTPSTVKICVLEENQFLPHSFQNNDKKLLFLTDREIFQFQRTSRQKKAVSGMNMELMSSLKPGNYVVHNDHGIGEFKGILQRDLGGEWGTREYLKVQYAHNDSLFVPVESAEKITKFIGHDSPKLTRLGSADWQKSQKKMKVETEKIAQELLKLYALREMAKGKRFVSMEDDMLKEFCESFPYEPTPGQAQTWLEITRDLAAPKPMDRLVCGDVGFGKTEMAMRAAFQAFRSGVQAAILAPITILAEQHYENFIKRIEDKNYGVKIALLSRFQTAAEQKIILKDIETGLVDIVIGTHRLLSDDIKFEKLGLLIIDEEQRFGVKQKEKLKTLRANIDVLTMTATPIPRTLNMSLNKLKDISTITTPPPGRLPVVTEVRKYNLNLIRERILREIERGGLVYFLHNEVRSIEGLAGQLRALIPEAKFIVAHGQLSATDLEERIKKFKTGEYNVLIASTIIENGIDLSNANTLIVNRAEKFGLSQLYQLRGRVGRGRTQAYAYFLYHGQKLELEAKKRLRAIVEASELGAGFQIAMRDLEIRGAGEILGANQAGTMQTVGVSHFMRMLQKTVEKMQSGEMTQDSTMEEQENITVEIPLSAYIPADFVPSNNEKIQVYQELASAETHEQLLDLKHDLREDYGTLPKEVENLCKVIDIKIYLRASNLAGIKINKMSHTKYEVVMRMGKHFSPDQLFGLIKNSPNKWVITAEALKLTFEKLPMTWYEELVDEIKLLKPKDTKKENKEKE